MPNILKSGVRQLKRWLHRKQYAIPKINSLLDQNQFEQAVAVTESAFQKYGRRPGLLLCYGKIQLRLADNPKAIEVFNEIPIDSKTGQSVLFEAASLLALVGDDDSACKIFRYLMREKNHCYAALWIAQRNARLKSYDAAVEAFTSVFLLEGKAPWDLVIRSVEGCSNETAAASAKRLSQEEARVKANFGITQFYFKMRSLLEAKLGRSESSLNCIRQATEASLAAYHKQIPYNKDCPPLKPSFLIIGAMKCGTTTLFDLITQHPLCIEPMEKEMQFFQFPQLQGNWYLDHFPRIENSQGYFAGDASPGYYMYDIHHRVKELLPDVKLLFIERDPVARAISHLRHNNRQGISTHSIKSVLSRIDDLEQQILQSPANAEQLVVGTVANKKRYNTYQMMGLYDLFLRRWARTFEDNQILTLRLEELTESPQEVMDRVFAFLGVPTASVKLEQTNQGNYSKSDPETVEVMTRLRQFYDNVKEKTSLGS